MPVNPPWLDPQLPDREHCVLGALLDRAAEEHPGRVFALFEDDTSWTYAETQARVQRLAGALAALGVGRGDRVLVWLPNGPDILAVWFAINYLGAVYAPINVAYRGELLRHVITNSGGRIMVAHASLIERLDAASIGEVRQILTVSSGTPPELGVEMLPLASVLDRGPPLARAADVMPWDTQSIIYTSGTTGPSKGVLCSYLQIYVVGIAAVGFIAPGERVLINMPLFHIGCRRRHLWRSGTARLGRHRRRLQHGKILGPGAAHGLRHRPGAGRQHDRLPQQEPTTRGRPRQSPAPRPGDAGQRHAKGARRALRLRILHRLRHDGGADPAGRGTQFRRHQSLRQATYRRSMPHRRRT
jgi:hypothetical protein